MIAAIQHGRVAEVGTHSQLMDLKGVYYDLVTAQMVEMDEDTSKGENDFKFNTITLCIQ